MSAEDIEIDGINTTDIEAFDILNFDDFVIHGIYVAFSIAKLECLLLLKDLGNV